MKGHWFILTKKKKKSTKKINLMDGNLHGQVPSELGSKQ